MEIINNYLYFVEHAIDIVGDKKLEKQYNKFVEIPTLRNFKGVVSRMDEIEIDDGDIIKYGFFENVGKLADKVVSKFDKWKQKTTDGMSNRAGLFLLERQINHYEQLSKIVLWGDYYLTTPFDMVVEKLTHLRDKHPPDPNQFGAELNKIMLWIHSIKTQFVEIYRSLLSVMFRFYRWKKGAGRSTYEAMDVCKRSVDNCNFKSLNHYIKDFFDSYTSLEQDDSHEKLYDAIRTNNGMTLFVFKNKLESIMAEHSGVSGHAQ